MRLLFRIFVLSLVFFRIPATAQVVYEKLIQVSGVVMTPDSLMGISDVTITVKHKDKGTYSSPLGVFSIVCFKGDTLHFSALGFRSKDVPILDNTPGDHLSMIQLMTQDTFYLDETIIHYLPSKERFNYVFQNFQPPNDMYEIARINTRMAAIRMLAMTLEKDGRESQHYIQNEQAFRAAYAGQQPPQNIFNPLKWAEFIDAWKRGDFRKKKASSSY